MSNTYIKHNGFISSISYDNLTPWYTTQENNEVISFIDSDGSQRHLNSLYIEADTAPLYIRILPSNHCVYVPASDSFNLEYKELTSIQVMGNSGQNIRWSGLFY